MLKNVYYINLKHRVDRRRSIEKQLSQLGWQGTRFDAIRNEYGAIGCSLSHLKLIRMAKDKNLDFIVILEDDIHFTKPQIFLEQLNNFLQSKIEFDVLLLAGNNRKPYKRINEFCIKVENCQTTTGYIVRKHFYDIFIKNIEEGIINLLLDLRKLNKYAIDQQWKILQREHNFYLITPLTVSQLPNYSDIEGKYHNYSYHMLKLDK